MEVNTAADMGNQKFETQDAADRLASVLASDPELVGIDTGRAVDGNGISPAPQGKAPSGMDAPPSKQANAFTQMFDEFSGQTVYGQKIGETDALPSSYSKSGDTNGFSIDGEIPIDRLTQKTPKDISAGVDLNDFGKILDFEMGDGAKAQTINYENSEAPQNAPVESSGNAPASNGTMGKKNPYINIDEVYPKLRTEKNTAYFWSGKTDGIGGQDVAADIATSRGGVTLEVLVANNGIDMPEWNIKDKPAIEAWELASAAYAEQVSGEVRAVVGKNLREDNVWENIELPRLKLNPNVTKIITIDPVAKVEITIFER